LEAVITSQNHFPVGSDAVGVISSLSEGDLEGQQPISEMTGHHLSALTMPKSATFPTVDHFSDSIALFARPHAVRTQPSWISKM